MEENNQVISQATIPEENEAPGSFNLLVRFNKEDVNLDHDSAVSLAQKGMKFELIENDFSRIRELARQKGVTLSQYVSELEESAASNHQNELLQRCNGDRELCDRIIELENANTKDIDISEIRENFPEIDSIEKLPEQVTENARLRGSNLLDEYLRYLLKLGKSRAENELASILAESSSTGSQSNPQNNACDIARNEFIKGIWGRN